MTRYVRIYCKRAIALTPSYATQDERRRAGLAYAALVNGAWRCLCCGAPVAVAL